MTNEELAVIIKQGNTQLMERLYLQNKGVIYQYAYWYYTKYRARCDSSGVVMDDLIQEGYFALCDTVQAYKPESGYKFLAFIKYPIQNRFNALVGYRVKKDLQEPINNASCAFASNRLRLAWSPAPLAKRWAILSMLAFSFAFVG